MSRRKNARLEARRFSWRALAVVALIVGGLVGAGLWARRALAPRAAAEPTPSDAAATTNGTAYTGAGETDYARRVVAYVYETEPVTRAELGEYLIDRCGPEKLEVLINKKIIEHEARLQAIEVSAAEVESAIAEDLQGTPDQANLLRQLLGRYKMNLHEWKEEVVKPRLLLTRLAKNGIHIGQEELRRAFLANYGDKVECRVILFPANPDGEKEAIAEHAKVRSSADAFDRAARNQHFPDYAATGGKVRPFGRYQMDDDELDRVAFSLQPGEISELVRTKQGIAILRCERRIPAQQVTFDSVREKLVREITDKQLAEAVKLLIPSLRSKANPQVLLKRPRLDARPEVPGSEPRADQVVAWYGTRLPITREDLGEYLIACFGVEKLELLVNRRIIDKECARRGIVVSDNEVSASLKADMDKLAVTPEIFAKRLLKEEKKSLYEYREDAVRSRMLLERLAGDRVKITEADIKLAYDAYHGEKMVCRMILWPPDQMKFAMKDYPKIRDSEKAFAEAAKRQPSASLAMKGGLLDPFGRHTLGDDNLENEAFRLQPGEVSTMIGTPQGNVVLRCDRRIKPDGAPLESVRKELEEDVRKRKTQVEMQVCFRELANKANPKLLLRDPNKPANLKAEVHHELANLKDLGQPVSAPGARQHKPQQ